MTETVFVTNRTDTALTDGYGGIFYEFLKGKPVEVPVHVAKPVSYTHLTLPTIYSV